MKYYSEPHNVLVETYKCMNTVFNYVLKKMSFDRS